MKYKVIKASCSGYRPSWGVEKDGFFAPFSSWNIAMTAVRQMLSCINDFENFTCFSDYTRVAER